MSCNKIGDRIKELRANKTQAEVAKALNVMRQTVDQWENGTRDLKTQYTISLADYFGVSCDYILRGIKAENVPISKIGLSDVSIEKIKFMSDIGIKEDTDRLFSNVEYKHLLNCIVESPSFIKMLRNLKLYYKFSNSSPQHNDSDNYTGKDMLAAERLLAAVGEISVPYETVALVCLYEACDAFKNMATGILSVPWPMQKRYIDNGEYSKADE